MEIVVNLSADDFNEEQQTIVKDALGLNDGEEFNRAIGKLAKAATLEYINMFVEKGLPTRADEVKQDRLYFLIKYYYEDRIPHEGELSSIYQLNSSQSASLLRNTRSRYRTKIGNQVNSSVRAVVSTATKNPSTDNWEMCINSDVILEELNILIGKKGPRLKKVRIKPGSAGEYIAEEDTYQLLRTELGL